MRSLYWSVEFLQKHCGEEKTNVISCHMDEGRKRVVGITAAILTAFAEQSDDLREKSRCKVGYEVKYWSG